MRLGVVLVILAALQSSAFGGGNRCPPRVGVIAKGEAGAIVFIDAGDKVVALLHTYARGRGSGVDVEVPVAHVLTFKGGKCTGYVSYHDRAEALRVAGLGE